jgi:hypothetical protein
MVFGTRCSIPFLVPYGSSKTVTCGGAANQGTDMTQFIALGGAASALQGYAGFTAYCLQNNPVCTCSNQTAESWECCDGTNPQAFDLSTNPARPKVKNLQNLQSLLGVPVGHKFGFCFVPYPSAATSINTRCLPSAPQTPTLVGGNVQTGAAGLTVGAAFAASLQQIASVDASAPAPATVSQESVDSYLSASIGAVLGVAGGSQETFTSLCAEMYQNKYVILGSAGIALLVSLAFTQLLRFFAKPMCVLVLAFTWAMLGICTAVLGYKAGVIDTTLLPQSYLSTNPSLSGSDGGDTFMMTPGTPGGQRVGQAQMNLNLIIIATVVVGLTFLAYNVVLCVMFRRIMLAAEVVQEAGRCVAAMPAVILFPLVQWLFIAAYFVWFVILFLYLASAGGFNADTRTFLWDDAVRRCIILHVFAMLWARSIILSTGNMIVAGATAQV